jgi:hypothetical protein
MQREINVDNCERILMDLRQVNKLYAYTCATAARIMQTGKQRAREREREREREGGREGRRGEFNY